MAGVTYIELTIDFATTTSTIVDMMQGGATYSEIML
jgi:hypothetical protein